MPVKRLRRLLLTPHAHHGAWSYTIAPTGAADIGLTVRWSGV
jgi:hypothetical protein